MGKEPSPEDLEARKGIAQAFAAVFALLAGGSFVGRLPSTVSVIAGGLALAGLIAAWRFAVDARGARLAAAEAEDERRRAEFERRVTIAPISEIDPTTIGVDRAEQTILDGGGVPTYLPRAADERLRAAVAAAFDDSGPWIVVVEGTAKVGKSRSLFEALCQCADDREPDLVAPVDADALRLLLTPGQDLGRVASRAVLWLDDIEPFLNDGVTMATLRDWHAGEPGRVVAATYGGKGRERIAGAATSDLATIATDVLQHARKIALEATTLREFGAALPSDLTADESAALERYGLAAYLVAAPALESKLFTGVHAAGHDPCPEGVAVVYAAVDWARCGRTDPIAEGTLRSLWPSYLPPEVPATEIEFDAGLAWALRPVAGSIALLQQTGSYQAYDYVVRLVRDNPDSQPAREESWTVAIETAADAQASAVAYSAYLLSRLDDAVTAFERARESSVSEVAAIAGYNLGFVLGELGRSEDALVVYDDVVARYGDLPEPALRERVAGALVNKGVRLGELGRSEDALVVYDDVVARYGDAPEPALREAAAQALSAREQSTDGQG